MFESIAPRELSPDEKKNILNRLLYAVRDIPPLDEGVENLHMLAQAEGKGFYTEIADMPSLTGFPKKAKVQIAKAAENRRPVRLNAKLLFSDELCNPLHEPQVFGAQERRAFIESVQNLIGEVFQNAGMRGMPACFDESGKSSVRFPMCVGDRAGMINALNLMLNALDQEIAQQYVVVDAPSDRDRGR